MLSRLLKERPAQTSCLVSLPEVQSLVTGSAAPGTQGLLPPLINSGWIILSFSPLQSVLS